jgi:hypothetical protein
VVEHSLGSDGAALKEYTLGVEVFERGADFDPRIDTIVRTHARRLRAKLEEYYRGGAGCADPILIEVPKGHYVPMVRWMPACVAVGAITDGSPGDRRQRRERLHGIRRRRHGLPPCQARHNFGVHDPARAQALIYEPQKDGSMRLVAVEFIFPDGDDPTTADNPPPPPMFGQPFHYVGAPFDVWALHAWVWRENPSGLFADWNPNVSCQYTL